MNAVDTIPGRGADLELAARCAQGDARAFETMMRRHNQTLYRTARSILKDDAEAEDAVQDAYLLAYRRLAQFRGESSLSTWLTRIVVNEAVARLRRQHRRANIIDIVDGADWEEASMDADTPMDGASAPETPDAQLARSQTRSLIEARIDRLPAPLRAVFMLRAVEEMSVDDTAAALGISEALVRTRYFRARALLRPLLARDLDHKLEEAFSFDGARCDRIVNGVLRRLGV
ncbi:MAG: RNA polymerase sigma factor [Gammaproteobacteria bacterium]